MSRRLRVPGSTDHAARAAVPPPAGSVECAVTAGIARLMLRSPHLNALSVAMWQALRAHGEALAARDDVHLVIVQGADGHFAAGADIREFSAVRHDESSGRRYHLELLAPALEALRALPIPVIAAIQGHCIGGGLEIALACDLRIAAADASLGAPVGRLGFPLALPELVPLLDLVGPGVAADLLLAGRLLSGIEAQACGLVQRTVPAAGFDAAVVQIVEAVQAGSPLAARLNKRFIRLAQMRGGRLTEADIAGSFGFFGSHDYREGLAAFLQRRSPRFTGR